MSIHPRTEEILRAWNNGDEPDSCPGLAEILYRSFGDKDWRNARNGSSSDFLMTTIGRGTTDFHTESTESPCRECNGIRQFTRLKLPEFKCIEPT
jgi:hypothetical protein